MEELYKYFGIYFDPEKVSKQYMIDYLRETIKEYNKMKSNEYQQRKSLEMLENYSMDYLTNESNEKILDVLLRLKSEIKCLQEPEKRYEIKELYKKINNEEKRKNYKSNINSSEETGKKKTEGNDSPQIVDESQNERKTSWSLVGKPESKYLVDILKDNGERIKLINFGQLYYSDDILSIGNDSGIFVLGLSKINNSEERIEIIFCELRKVIEEKKEKIVEKVFETDNLIDYIMKKEEGFLGIGALDCFGRIQMKTVKDKLIRDRKIVETLKIVKQNKCTFFAKANAEGRVVEFSKLIDEFKDSIKQTKIGTGNGPGEGKKGEDECQK